MSNTYGLLQILDHFRQGSRSSVQNGGELNDFDKYMHIERPIESMLYQEMENIYNQGKGLILVVGNAGDGKSHTFASIKSNFNGSYNNDIINSFKFYNDASESYSHEVDSMRTLKISLLDFSVANIDKENNNCKMVMAINLGKVDEFINDEECQEPELYPNIISALHKALPQIDAKIEGDFNTTFIRVIDLSAHQMFKLCPDQVDLRPDNKNKVPLSSDFMTEALVKITYESIINNPIYINYINEKNSDPTKSYIRNYQFLAQPQIQKAIVSMIIEAIIKYRLVVSPREFFGFVYSILVYKDTNTKNLYTLLPNLIFEGGENRILKALSLLDPLKSGNQKIDSMIEAFMTEDHVAESEYTAGGNLLRNTQIEAMLNGLYQNGDSPMVDAVRFLVRYHYLMNHNTFDAGYVEFVNLLVKCQNEKKANDLNRFYCLVDTSFLLSKGIKKNEKNYVPFPYQSQKYKFIAKVDLKRRFDLTINEIKFNQSNPNIFEPFIRLYWELEQSHKILKLDMDFQLYRYLSDLQRGKAFNNNDPDKILYFSNFVDTLVQNSNAKDKVKILSHEITLEIDNSEGFLQISES